MSRTPVHDVVVAGAGPVGLFLACCLSRAGIRTAVIEKRRERSLRSRSIGIHPPSLELLSALSLAESFVDRGVRVTVGRAYAAGRCLGSVSFTGGPKPFDFVLSLPQHETERILAEALQQAGVPVLRGFEVARVTHASAGLEVAAVGDGAAGLAVPCRYLVGCDGVASRIRGHAGIAFRGSTYPDAYVMGDFPDRTGFGAEARVFLEAGGLVESFPLPGGRRRWVIATHPREPEPRAGSFARTVRERTGHDPGRPVDGVAAFAVHHFLAERFYRGRVILAGDAAHVVSPIGGQGMNLGWLGAADLTASLARILLDGADPEAELTVYQHLGRRRARRARRRAELNMALGRRARWPALRRVLVRALLRPPARRVMARLWTMRRL